MNKKMHDRLYVIHERKSKLRGKNGKKNRRFDIC